MKQSVSNQGSPFVQMRAHSGGTAEAMRSQQAQGSQQAELTAGSEVTEVPEPRGCTAAQGASTQSLSTAVAAAAAVAAALLTLGQRCQDSGGSKSCGTGRGRGTMGLALRLFLLLLLAVALPARAAQAAPLRVRGADELAMKVSPAAWLQEDFQPRKPAARVSEERTFQAPFLVSAHKPSSHRRGPPRGRNKPGGDRKSLEAAKPMDRTLSDLERRREMEGEAVLKAQFPGGSRGSLAASAAGREAMAGTVTGDWDRDLHHLEMLVKNGLKMLELGEDEPDDEDYPVDEDDLDSQPVPISGPLGDGEGVSAGRTFPGPLVDVARKPSSHRRGPLRMKKKPGGASKSLKKSQHLEEKRSDVDSQHDAAGTSTHADNIWRRVFCWGPPCLFKLMAIVAGAALFLLICCVAIWYCWKRKWCSHASSEEEPSNSGKVLPTCYPSCTRLPLSALPWLQQRHEAFPKPTPPKRDPLPLSPLVLFPGHE